MFLCLAIHEFLNNNNKNNNKQWHEAVARKHGQRSTCIRLLPPAHAPLPPRCCQRAHALLPPRCHQRVHVLLPCHAVAAGHPPPPWRRSLAAAAAAGRRLRRLFCKILCAPGVNVRRLRAQDLLGPLLHDLLRRREGRGGVGVSESWKPRINPASTPLSAREISLTACVLGQRRNEQGEHLAPLFAPRSREAPRLPWQPSAPLLALLVCLAATQKRAARSTSGCQWQCQWQLIR